MPNEQAALWRMPAIRKLLMVSLLGFTSFDLTLSSLPSWAVSGGASIGAAGLVTAVFLLVTVLIQMVVPTLVARIGAGRVLALGLLALGSPAPLCAVTHDLRWLVVISTVRGCGFAILTVVGTFLTFSLAPAGRHGESVGLYGLVLAIPSLLAVPAGVALTEGGLFGWAAVLAGAPSLAVPLALSLGSATAVATVADGHHQVVGHRAAVLGVLSPTLVLLAVTIAAGGVLTVLPIYHPSGQLATVALLVMGAAAAVARWRVGAMADRVTGPWLLPVFVLITVLGTGALALGLLVDAGAGTYAALLLAAAVFGAGQGAVENLSQVNAFARAGASRASTASAMWNAGFDAGIGLGAFAVGAISATVIGFPGTLAGCAVLIALTVPLAVSSSRAAL